jgi:hypothetical protein
MPATVASMKSSSSHCLQGDVVVRCHGVAYIFIFLPMHSHCSIAASHSRNVSLSGDIPSLTLGVLVVNHCIDWKGNPGPGWQGLLAAACILDQSGTSRKTITVHDFFPYDWNQHVFVHLMLLAIATSAAEVLDPVTPDKPGTADGSDCNARLDSSWLYWSCEAVRRAAGARADEEPGVVTSSEENATPSICMKCLTAPCSIFEQTRREALRTHAFATVCVA